ncbi:MAG TPA: ATP-grasp domain-containing protein, partial [Rhodanobacter sp.]|nr:ATP-grasp domain-containing protein [Rhodanobacter sp.]
GELLGNEMAPRVHNSGHWTIEGACTSQFENHVRAVLGLPLGDTGARGLSAMLNWIGDLPQRSAVLKTADAHWHDYGKQARPGRKVGHATVCAPDADQLAARLAGMAASLERETQVAPVLQALGHSQETPLF